MARSKTSWKPGVSPNPGGRPAVVGEIRALAQEHSRTAIETLVRLMGDKKVHPTARARACEAILDRALGRPEQPIKDTSERIPERSSVEILEYIDRIFGAVQIDAKASIEAMPEAPREPEDHVTLPQAKLGTH